MMLVMEIYCIKSDSIFFHIFSLFFHSSQPRNSRIWEVYKPSHYRCFINFYIFAIVGPVNENAHISYFGYTRATVRISFFLEDGSTISSIICTTQYM